MSIKDLICDSCLGSIKHLHNNIYKCESCDREYLKDSLSEEETILLTGANKTLRMGNFDDAYEEFSDIVSKYPYCFEAYYGMTLATHGILFVDDILENKKVPTCYSICINSFLEDENFKKALEYCPSELKENYLEQARKIEVIRTEWLDKASKEPPYDIFISFKQSDREKGLEFTPDYYSALQLYNHLTYKLGLKVFFSPETLKNKISEKYEPYIYSALNTSKVMIVYGENPAYLNSTWVKNEWIRFLRKIKNKEKADNSLVVVYKNFDAYSLPKELSSMQALRADSFDFLDTLISHIEKVFELSKSTQKLERKEIKLGQIATRSRTIGQNKIIKREIGSTNQNTEDVSLENALNSIELFVSRGRHDMVSSQLNEILKEHPNNGKAKYLRFLIENKINGLSDLKNIIASKKNRINLRILDELISNLDKQTALEIITIIKEALIDRINKNFESSKGFDKSSFEEDVLSMFNILSSYDYEESDYVNQVVFDASCLKDSYLKLFNQALRTLDDEMVDEYVKYHIEFVKNIKDNSLINKEYVLEHTEENLTAVKDIKVFLLNRALKVDEGNPLILDELYNITHDIKYLELSLSYTNNEKEYINLIKKYIDRYSKNANIKFDEILKYIPSNRNDLYKRALKERYSYLKSLIISSKLYKDNYLSQTKYYAEQLLLEESNNSELLFDLLKYNLGCATDKDLINYPKKLSEEEIVKNSLLKFDTETQNKVIEILDKQEQTLKATEEHNKKLKEEEEKENVRKSQSRRRIFVFFLGLISLILALYTFISFALNDSDKKPITSWISIVGHIIVSILALIDYSNDNSTGKDSPLTVLSIAFAGVGGVTSFIYCWVSNNTFVFIPIIAIFVSLLYYKTKS